LNSEPVLRSATEADLDAIMASHARAFGTRSDARYQENWRRQVAVDDIMVAVGSADPSGPLVGSAMYYRLTLQLPGGRGIAAAGGGMSLVEPTHRRRGLYRKMYCELLRTAQSRGYPILVGMPSQGTIYRRFGLGPSSQSHTVRIDRRFMNLSAPADVSGSVRVLDATQAYAALPPRYAAFAASTAGSVSRSAPWWDLYIADGRVASSAQTERFYFGHADGYAAYRLRLGERGRTIVVDEVCAGTEQAHSDLWTAISGIDSFDTIEAEFCPSDPLPLKLDDIRAYTVIGVRDGLWLRIMDVAEALSARNYDVDDVLVLKVVDPIALAGGTFRITVRDGEAHCVQVAADPDVTLALDDLGSLYLGGFRARQLARAGRLTARDPQTCDRLDALFATRELPFCNTAF